MCARVFVSACVCACDADSLQVAAVVGAHAGQSRLLLGFILCLLLGIGLLPDPSLLLVHSSSKYKNDNGNVRK